jgi:DNA repair protein RAD50
LQEAEVTLRKLRERVAPLAAEVQRLQSSGQPRQAALAAALAARDEARARHEAAGKDADARARALAARAERFCSLQREVARRAQSGASADLQTALDAERDAGANLASSKREIEGAQKAEADATRALTRAHAAMAELKENLRLRKVREQLGEVDAQLDRLAAKLDQERAADGTSPAELLQGAEHAKASTLAHRAESIGKRAIHGEQIKRTEGELKSAEYKGVDVAHRTKAIDVVAHGLVVKDLDAYYKALDRSLMKFHSKKMEDINATIRELWQRTYQGHDIDSIEIQSEHEGETATGRRIQKYRVMMRRGDTLLDMRGRCSAGQKVLASLIIRLALAETFCLNCGILALDEPTTNLDHANVESFARALNEIIQQRRTQANFQLIVITHDEPFVQLVRRAPAGRAPPRRAPPGPARR